MMPIAKARIGRLALPISILLFAIIGCDRGQNAPSDAPAESESSVSSNENSNDLQHALALAEAQALIDQGKLDEAAKQLYEVMIRHGDDEQAKWLTAKVEAARGNTDTSVEIASTIDPTSQHGRDAVGLQAAGLINLGRPSQAADVLLKALEDRGDMTAWRHQAWQLLNQVGRRHAASQQAIHLCRLGLASDSELLSLVCRKFSHPAPEMTRNGFIPEQMFRPGLGMARWHFSRGDHQQALQQLAEQASETFENAEAEALYGRLLAETQDWDGFQKWLANVSADAKQVSDYWAALGVFFSDNLSHEAAARVLMESIRRDPTDAICYQRLSKAMTAFGLRDDGEQFRVHGITVEQSIQMSNHLASNPGSQDARKQLAQLILKLGRPFETLAWTTTMIPQNAFQARQQIIAQRLELIKDPAIETMVEETSLIGMDPEQFEYQASLDEMIKRDRIADSRPTVSPREVLAQPRLINRAKESGIEFQYYKDVTIDLTTIPIHESLGGGIAAFDFDLDGNTDLYLAQGSGDPPTDQCTRSNQLYRNVGGTFIDCTTPSITTDHNYSSGLAAGDVNQDGFLDLMLGSLGHNRLLINNGDGTFREASEQLGEFDDRFTSSIAIADINGDTLPDLFESNYIEMEGGFDLPEKGPDGHMVLPAPLSHFAEVDRWFENRGDGTFQSHDISRDIASPGTSLGLVVTDFQADGKNEVFVGIDVRPNHFLIQTDNNSFLNAADALGLANGFEGAANGCMGIATGDFNRDGQFDMQIANYYFEPANLYLQNESGNYTDQAMRFGLAEETKRYVGFGTKAVDFDRNGFLDFIVSNGHIFDVRYKGQAYQMEPQVFLSDGRQLKLAKVDDPSGYWDKTYLGRTIAMLDYDRDGSTDFAISHLDQPHALLHNETAAGGSWIQLELIGTTTERDAIGARVTLTAEDATYTEWVTAGDGYLCSDEPIVSFAIADASPDSKVSLEIQWPSGSVQSISNLSPARRYLIVEGQQGIFDR